ncbi:MAG: pilus assembly protein PilZ [Treponema sp.]|jgi:hypothetical protein|nr:pilus assembly protein PilZ [Treponema sp.]
MSTLTSQRIAEYYERFRTIEVTFNKEINAALGLVPQEVQLKCVGDFWPCVLYAVSFEGAKAACSIKSGILAKLEQVNQLVSLRLSFRGADAANPVTFFIASKALGYTPCEGASDVALFHLQFTQRPPDDLIEIVGRLLEANVTAVKRKDERVPVQAELCRRMSLLAKESAVFIEGVPRRCILRELAFSGAKVILMGVAKFLVERDTDLRLDFEDPRESFLLKGKCVHSESVEGRKGLAAVTIMFDENALPMGYKMRLSAYLNQTRLEARPGSEGWAGGEGGPMRL